MDCCPVYYYNTANSAAYQTVEIGSTTTLTTLSGSIVFDGAYHIRGPLRLTNGTFTLKQGTIFYMDGQVVYSDPVCANTHNPLPDLGLDLTYILVDGAKLVLEGATIKARCDEMWEGIRLTGDGEIDTGLGASSQRSKISDAVCAIRSYNDADCLEYNHNTYSLKHTDFFSCYSGLIDCNKENASVGEGIIDCFFQCYNMKYPFNPDPITNIPPRGFAGIYFYADENLPLTGYYSGAEFTHNTIEGFGFTGFGGYGSFVTVKVNNFNDNFMSSIDLTNDLPNELGTDNIYIFENNIALPTDNLNVQVVGIKAHKNTEIYGNTITGHFPALTSPDNRNIGIYAVGERVVIGRNGYLPNNFYNLDQGIRSMIYDWGNLISNNNFENNRKAIVIAENNSVEQEVYINCNEITNTNTTVNNGITFYGIEVEPNSGLIAQGDCGGPMTGNNFAFQSTTWESLWNDGSNLQIDYYHGSNEGNIIFTNFNPTDCGIDMICSSYGFDYGTRVQGQDSIAISEMMDSLKYEVGSAKDLAYYERQIKRFHADNGYVPELNTYVNTLPGYNLKAFNNLSLFLLRHYRSHNNSAAVQQVRGQLLAHNSADAEIENEIKFFDLQARLGKLLLNSSGSLTTQDSTDLADIASSGTAHWHEACFAMQYYHSGVICNSGYNQKNNKNEATTQDYLGTAYPNPTAGVVTIPYAVSGKGQNASLHIAEVTTGRLVSQQSLNMEADKIEVDLTKLNAGLYAYTLLIDEVPSGTKKLVVIK